MEALLGVTGAYFFLLGVWWCIQASKRCYYSKQQHLEFHSTVTFPCCHRCQKIPLEGIVKLLSSLTFIILSIGTSNVLSDSQQGTHYEDLHIATIFAFFAVSAIFDIMRGYGKKIFIEDLDYVVLSMSFGVQGILHGFHTSDETAQEWTIYNLLMMASLACFVTVVLEMRVRNNAFIPLARGMAVMLLGSWSVHSFFLLQDPIPSFNADSHLRVITLSIYFALHCAINFIILASLWLLVLKCLNQSCCPCSPVLPYTSEPGSIFLENRIRFDYPSMDHFDPD